MDEMSVRLDDGTDLGEDQKKIFRPWTSYNKFFFFFFFFCIDQDLLFFSFSYCPSQLRGWMDDGTNLGETFFLLASVRPD